MLYNSLCFVASFLLYCCHFYYSQLFVLNWNPLLWCDRFLLLFICVSSAFSTVFGSVLHPKWCIFFPSIFIFCLKVCVSCFLLPFSSFFVILTMNSKNSILLYCIVFHFNYFLFVIFTTVCSISDILIFL